MRRPVAVLGAVVLVVIGASTSSAAVRYLDPVFASVQETLTNETYGRATDYTGTPIDLKLDMWEPAGDTETKRPVFIWAHGGYFTEGDKSNARTGSPDNVRDFMTKRGWVTISINYRLNPTLPEGVAYFNSTRPFYDAARLLETIRDAQHDFQAAIRWARANATTYGLDPDRIAIGGHSAGATAAVAVAMNSDDPGDSGNPGFSSRPTAAIGTGTANVPLMDVHPDPLAETPLAMYHGDQDPWPHVLPQSLCLLDSLLLNVCEFHLYPGEGHYRGIGMYDWPSFLYRYVIEPQPAPLVPPGTVPPIPAVRVPSDVLAPVPAFPFPLLPPL